MTSGEATSGKSSAIRYKIHRLWAWFLEMVQRYGEYTYEQGELKGIVGEERRGKETDRCPLTLPPLESAASRRAKTTVRGHQRQCQRERISVRAP
jgi:hypothetical protein